MPDYYPTLNRFKQEAADYRAQWHRDRKNDGREPLNKETFVQQVVSDLTIYHAYAWIIYTIVRSFNDGGLNEFLDSGYAAAFERYMPSLFINQNTDGMLTLKSILTKFYARCNRFGGCMVLGFKHEHPDFYDLDLELEAYIDTILDEAELYLSKVG